ncbi:MAG: ATP-binding protein [Gammaproteobacteria bacterium]|nr:ATP-binding protein [Gammaproteobacteria bacterium]
MNIKFKLIGSFIGLALLALSIGTVALYDSYSTASLEQTRNHLQVITKLADFDNLTSEKIPDGLIVRKQLFDGSIIDLINPSLINLPPYLSDDTDTIEINEISYVWSSTPLNKNSERIIILSPLVHQDLESFISQYGAEISIFTFIIIWSTLWAALVVNSLISKVNAQKILLESQRQQALDESKAKSLFLAHISHEIRTPLSAVIGYSETLLHSDQPMTERLGFINTIIRNGNHILNLVNDLLDLSKIEANKLEVESININLISLLQDIEKLFHQQCKSKGIEFKIQYHFPLVETIISDPVRLKQILINLCSNAIKFTKSGYIYLDVQKSSDNKLQFMIEDSGIGMTDEQLSRIFSAYTQANSSTTRKFGGTGLGLSLSKHLANMLGGDIDVCSQSGRGSTFTLTINAGDLANSKMINHISEHTNPETMTDTISTHRHLSGKVLLAEDNQDNQNLFSIYLNKCGLEPDIAHNGQQAVEFVLNNDYDLIFMDMQMPIMDGIEATSSLRKKGFSTPIVALTANAMKEDMDQFYGAGCDEFLTKPLKRDKLLATCAKYLTTVDDRVIVEPIVSTILQDEPDLIDIINRFCEKLPEMTKTLHTLHAQGDYDELARQAHDLKGVSGNMGYMEINQLAGRLEFQIANKDNKEISYLLKKLESLQKRIALGLEQERA